MEVILISTGIFQEYLITNIKQLLLLGYDVTLITDSNYLNKIKIKNINIVETESLSTDFDSKSKLNRSFRNGFWHSCSKRLFLLYEYMKKNDRKRVVHLENDVMLYTKFEFNFEQDKIYLTMDAKNRCIPGIIYIPSYNFLEKLVNNYNFSKDDMFNMAKFFKENTDICKTFPLIDDSHPKTIYNENFNEFNSIFDAAAIGQYLGGVDPRNIRGDSSGFVNETCIYKYNKYKFKWLKIDKYFFPHIIVGEKIIPINCLHVHSKALDKFSIESPLRNKFIE